MSRVMAEWLPSSGYELAMPCELETYGPGNTNDDEYTCELWVPVRKTK